MAGADCQPDGQRGVNRLADGRITALKLVTDRERRRIDRIRSDIAQRLVQQLVRCRTVGDAARTDHIADQRRPQAG